MDLTAILPIQEHLRNTMDKVQQSSENKIQISLARLDN